MWWLFSRVHATLYVTMSVRRSVGPSVRRKSLRPKSLFWVFRAEWRSDLSYCPCPTTIQPLPTRTQLMLPCIQPCFICSPKLSKGGLHRLVYASGICIWYVHICSLKELTDLPTSLLSCNSSFDHNREVHVLVKTIFIP